MRADRAELHNPEEQVDGEVGEEPVSREIIIKFKLISLIDNKYKLYNQMSVVEDGFLVYDSEWIEVSEA